MRMKPVKIHEAKTNFSRLIGLVEAGAEVIVQRDDHPVAKIVPYPVAAHARKAGALAGRIEIAGDFDAIPEGFGDYAG
jgi:antitoxin (DNA-binding transcriptional repressor) of toxin-antitoxin stability system